MYKQMSIIYLILTALFVSCTDDHSIIEQPPDPDCCEEDTITEEKSTIPFLEHRWNQFVFERVEGDLQWFLNYGIINTPQGVALAYDGQYENGVCMYNKSSGEKLWQWESESYPRVISYHENLNALVVHAASNFHVIDADNGKVLKQFHHQTNNFNIGNYFGALIDDHIYYCRTNRAETEAWLVRSNVSDLHSWERIYSVDTSQTGGSEPNIQSYNQYKHPETGDIILIFQHRMAKPNRVDLVAYNLTTDSILWKHNDLSPNGNSNDQQIQIFKDKAYFLGVNTIYCVDMKTGEILWKDRHLNPLRGYLLGDLVYAEKEDLIIVKDDETRLTAYRPESGNVAWEITDLPHNGVDITYFDRYVYIAHDPLIAVDARTGEVHKETKQTANFDGMVAIDEENRTLFATNFHRLFAFDIEE